MQDAQTGVITNNVVDVVDSTCGYKMIGVSLSMNCQETKILWCCIS